MTVSVYSSNNAVFFRSSILPQISLPKLQLNKIANSYMPKKIMFDLMMHTTKIQTKNWGRHTDYGEISEEHWVNYPKSATICTQQLQ